MKEMMKDCNGCMIVDVTPEHRIHKYLSETIPKHSFQIFCESNDKLSEYHMYTVIATYTGDIRDLVGERELVWKPTAALFYEKGRLSMQTNYWLELTDEECNIIYRDYSKYKKPLL